MLHHVYSWSRIVGESSNVLRTHDQGHAAAAIDTDNATRRTKWRGRHITSGPGTDLRSATKLDDFLRLDDATSDSGLEASGQKDSEHGLRDIHLEEARDSPNTMFLQLYGVEETWLSLISQTTRLANTTDGLDRSKQKGDPKLSEVLDRRKKRLESMVCSFAAESKATVAPRPLRVDMEIDVYDEIETPRSCMVRALNGALVIFFYRRISNVHPWILQAHVRNVAQALRDFDNSCGIFNIDGPGSPWPVFMAGCEAVAKPDREYFSEWLDRAFAKTGFDRFKTIKACMEEVWQKRDHFSQGKGKGTQSITWVDICKEKHIYVLLS